MVAGLRYRLTQPTALDGVNHVGELDTSTAGDRGCYFYDLSKDIVFFDSPLAGCKWERIGVVVFDETVLTRMIKWGNNNGSYFIPEERKDMAKQLENLRRLTLSPARAVEEEEAKLKAARAAEERAATCERERAATRERARVTREREREAACRRSLYSSESECEGATTPNRHDAY